MPRFTFMVDKVWILYPNCNVSCVNPPSQMSYHLVKPPQMFFHKGFEKEKKLSLRIKKHFNCVILWDFFKYELSVSLVLPVGGDRLGCAVSYSKAERLARRHGSNTDDLDHDLTPCCTRERATIRWTIVNHITRIPGLHLWAGWPGESWAGGDNVALPTIVWEGRGGRKGR